MAASDGMINCILPETCYEVGSFSQHKYEELCRKGILLITRYFQGCIMINCFLIGIYHEAGSLSLHEYQELYPLKHDPNHQIFTWLHQKV
ncbi:hypothetical protein AVEN_252354-1 [Araneus ventricosus]|uniref:Uncharacterized protein n=1 Tax=Araneus ventricosus TaxID=182803 RepID=A0A4Y2AR29_ARAVE|nr:hypothetical protein AVEN_252354-1 [Araneus ventricosus]